MIIGHVGAALVAKRYRADVPLGALLLASFAPDISRAVLLVAGTRRADANLLTHALPWCVLLSLACGVVAWLTSRNRTIAVSIGALVLSHAVLDMISGRKPLWPEGPRAANLGSVWYAEFALEGVLLWGGWWLLRGRDTRWRWKEGLIAVCLMMLVQLAFIGYAISQRPWKERCLSHPAVPCADGSWLTASWVTPPWLVRAPGSGEPE